MKGTSGRINERKRTEEEGKEGWLDYHGRVPLTSSKSGLPKKEED